MELMIRKFRQWVVGLLVAAAVIGFWPHASKAQIIQPSLCANEVVAVNVGSANYPVYEVIKDPGVARTGPHDDCKRATPLPRGTRARVVATGTGPDRFGAIVPWSKLDYGAWILSSELQPVNVVAVTAKLAKVVETRMVGETTELVFPLSTPVPIEVLQSDRAFNLTFHNANGQLSSLREAGQLKNWGSNSLVKFTNPVVAQGSWQNISTNNVRFNFQLKPKQQWGYQMRYEGNNFVLSLRLPPKLTYTVGKPLKNLRIVLDPGHGSDPDGGKKESGAVGKTAAGVEYKEKDVNLQVAQLLEQELVAKGAIVTMTRTRDMFLSLDDRQVIINRVAPVLSLSIHHDATAPGRGAVGASVYWFHPQSRNLAASLLDYYARIGNRPILNNNGVLQKSFAVARPSAAPAILLEMGFMSNPQELAELVVPATQQRLAKVLGDGIVQWVIGQAGN
jgi:N-acetylmuramoyl-L-alanine amidase